MLGTCDAGCQIYSWVCELKNADCICGVDPMVCGVLVVCWIMWFGVSPTFQIISSTHSYKLAALVSSKYVDGVCRLSDAQ
jgi:hypothetical protein